MTNATAQCRAHLVTTIAECRKTVTMGTVYAEYERYAQEHEVALAKWDAINPDVDAILAMDKVAIREVPANVFDLVQNVLWSSPVAYDRRLVFGKEVTRRKAAETRLANAANKAAGAAYADGQAVQVHAFGHWYAGKVVRTTRTGSVVVEYTSGTGTTRQKTCTADLVRAA